MESTVPWEAVIRPPPQSEMPASMSIARGRFRISMLSKFADDVGLIEGPVRLLIGTGEEVGRLRLETCKAGEETGLLVRSKMGKNGSNMISDLGFVEFFGAGKRLPHKIVPHCVSKGVIEIRIPKTFVLADEPDDDDDMAPAPPPPPPKRPEPITRVSAAAASIASTVRVPSTASQPPKKPPGRPSHASQEVVECAREGIVVRSLAPGALVQIQHGGRSVEVVVPYGRLAAALLAASPAPVGWSFLAPKVRVPIDGLDFMAKDLGGQIASLGLSIAVHKGIGIALRKA